jgi:hypothetical protein
MTLPLVIQTTEYRQDPRFVGEHAKWLNLQTANERELTRISN